MKQLIVIDMFQYVLKSQNKGMGFKKTFWQWITEEDWAESTDRMLGICHKSQICGYLGAQRCKLVLRAVTFVGESELERCLWAFFGHRMLMEIRLDGNLGKHKAYIEINCDMNKIVPWAACSLWRLSRAMQSSLLQQLSLHSFLSATSSLLTAPP